MGHYEGTLKIENIDIIMKTKLSLIRFNGTSGTLNFDDRSFLKTLLGFTPYRDHKSTNAIHSDSSGVYTIIESLNFSTIDKIFVKYDVIDGSVVNGRRGSTLFSYVLDKISDFRTFCKLETKQYKKINKSVLNTITFYLEDDNHEEVNFNGDTLTFTLELIKI